MKTKAILFLVSTLILVIFSGCPNTEETPDPELKVTMKDATNVTETSFTANWDVNRTDLKSTTVEISTQSDFSIIEQVYKLSSNPTEKSQLVDGLKGATTYYYRILVTAENNDTGSGSSSVRTTFKKENIEVISSEDIKIRGDMSYLENSKEKLPLVICLGHYEISNLWKNEDIFYELIARGYACCTFNYRGLGNSDPWPLTYDIEEFEEYINHYARNDLHAVYTYLKSHPKIDSTTIALMGGSLGSNESMIGNNWPGVKCSVGLTTSRLGIEESGILHNVFFIASEQDCNIYYCYKEEAEFLYNNAEEPKKMMIISGDTHGLDMLINPDVGNEILNWIDARMENQ